MPRIEAIFKCLKCEEEFTALSGVQTSCKCGACLITPKRYSTSYINKGIAGNNFERLSEKVYFDDSEFFIMTERCNELWAKIQAFKFDDYRYFVYAHKSVEKSDCGKVFLSSISANFEVKVNTFENNRFEFQRSLTPDTNEELLYRRLKRYYNLLKGLQSGKFKGNNVTQMKTAFNYWERTQLDYYNHSFDV